MNQLYEHLFTSFSEKAKIKRDAIQIAHTLKTTYPNCNLPVHKTIKRVLVGETTNPRDTLLGFLSAFVLDKTEEEVLEADKKNKLGEFYKTFLEQTGNPTVATPPNMAPISAVQSTVDSKPRSVSKQYEKTKTQLLWALWLAVLLLVGYIFVSKRLSKQSLNLQMTTTAPIKGGTS